MRRSERIRTLLLSILLTLCLTAELSASYSGDNRDGPSEHVSLGEDGKADSGGDSSGGIDPQCDFDKNRSTQ